MAASTLSVEFSVPENLHTDRRSPQRWIFSHFLHYWYLGLIMVIGAFGNAYFAAFIPDLIGKAFNLILVSPSSLAGLARLALILVGSQILRSILQFGRNFGAELIGQRLERDIRQELYVSLLGKSMTFHSLQPVGDTMARATNDVREINFMFSPGINLVIGSGIFMLMPIIFAQRYHPSLILVPVLFTLAYAFALWQYLHELNPVTDEVRGSFGKMNTRLAEAIDGIETVKGTAQEGNEVDRFTANAHRFRNAYVRQGDIEARFLPLLLLGLAQAGGLLHSLILYSQSEISLGEVIAFFGLIQMLGFPTFVSLFAYSQISLGMAGARRILELINQRNDLDQNLQGYMDRVRGEIEFRNVSFSYGNDELTLENISFKAEPGQTIAIVGQTGAGKTTLVKLINRTYDVTEGQVLVDGVDVRDWNLEALRRRVSIIEQDIFLFSRSIEDNIKFGAQYASHVDIKNAAKQAQADEFILGFNKGFETVIGERGVTLSGGQRQRIALARAFLADPQILVLDDSTSAIDSATEDRIQRAIYAAARGRTTFIITHRLSQIRWADIILVLRQGHLSSVGNHEELLKTSAAYRRIFSE